jgi:hypothetical protein
MSLVETSTTPSAKRKTKRAKPAASTPADDLDRPLWGAQAIGREANILDEDGNVDTARVYYVLENGYLPPTSVAGPG